VLPVRTPIKSPLAGDFAFSGSLHDSETTMGHNIHTFKEARALALRVWRDAATFLFSIELALMVLVAVATVGGVFFAVLQDLRSLACFGFAIAYVATRSVLHVKRKLNWPFI
jgi:hypothetical protein